MHPTRTHLVWLVHSLKLTFSHLKVMVSNRNFFKPRGLLPGAEMLVSGRVGLFTSKTLKLPMRRRRNLPWQLWAPAKAKRPTWNREATNFVATKICYLCWYCAFFWWWFSVLLLIITITIIILTYMQISSGSSAGNQPWPLHIGVVHKPAHGPTPIHNCEGWTGPSLWPKETKQTRELLTITHLHDYIHDTINILHLWYCWHFKYMLLLACCIHGTVGLLHQWYSCKTSCTILGIP